MGEQLKNQGNEEFKAGRFEEALKFYQSAIDAEPTNVIYYTNKATALTKLKKYDEAVQTSLKAITVGRENNAAPENIAKCYNKVAAAEAARENIPAAIDALQKSIAEKSDPVAQSELKRLNDILAKKQKDLKNPENADQDKIDGDKFLKAKEYSKAVKSYSEAIKKFPEVTSLLGLRAEAQNSAGNFTEAISDAEKALKIDPKFAKAVLEKAKAFEGQKDYQGALEAYNKLLSVSPGNQDAIQGITQMHMKANQQKSRPKLSEAEAKRKMEEPDIRAILDDPWIQGILQDIQSNPKNAQTHFQNPRARPALLKLQEAGILS